MPSPVRLSGVSRCGCIRPPRRTCSWPAPAPVRTGPIGSVRGRWRRARTGCGSPPIIGGRTATRGARQPTWRCRRVSRPGSTPPWCRRGRRCGGRPSGVADLSRTCGSTCSMPTLGRWWLPPSASTGQARPGAASAPTSSSCPPAPFTRSALRSVGRRLPGSGGMAGPLGLRSRAVSGRARGQHLPPEGVVVLRTCRR
jgi:hypothetical protein